MRTTELMARMRLDASQFDRGLAQSQTNLAAFSRAATALPGGAGNVFGALARDAAGVAPIISSMPLAIAAVGASFVAVGASARSAGVEFEATLAKITTLGPEAERTLGSTRQAILDTFSSVAVTGSVTDLAEANYLLQSSGRSAEDAITDLNIAAKASVAGYTQVTTAVDGLTTVTNAWKDSQISTKTASDVLFSAVNVGKATFDDIASSIGLVAPLAASAGVRFQEVAAATAVLSNQGLRTSSIMEGLRSAIANIVKPTESFKKEYADLAREFGASRLQRDGLVQFLLDFQRESKGSRAALNALFGDITGQTAVLGLLKNGGNDAAAALKQMETAAGATDRALDIVNKTAKAQEQLVRNQISGAWTQFGELLSTVTLPILEQVARAVNRISRGANFAAKDVATVLANAGKSPASQLDEDKQLGDVSRVVKQFEADPVTFLRALSRDNVDQLATELQRLRKEGTFGIPAAMVTALREERSRRDAEPVAEAFSQFRAEGLAATAAAKQAQDEEDARNEATRKADAAAAVRKAAADRAQQRATILREAEQLTTQLSDKAIEALQGTAGALQSTMETTLRDGAKLLASGVLTPELQSALTLQLEQFEQLQTEMITATQLADRTTAALAAATSKEKAEVNADNTIADGSEARLRALEAELVTQLAITKNLKARKELEAQLTRIADARAGKIEKEDPAKKQARTIRDQTEALGDLAQQLATVGDKLGILPKRAVDALRGIGALVEQGKKLQAAFGAGSGVSTIAKVGLGIGVAAGVASLVAGVLGESPEDKQRREELRKNTAAIQDLTQRVGDLSTSSVSGRSLGRVSSGVTQILAWLNGAPRADRIRFSVGGLASSVGSSQREFEDVAQSLGITLNGTVQSFRDLKAAIDKADLASFTDTYAGSLQRLDDTLRLDGITDAVEILRRRVATLTDAKTGFPALADALAGIDLTSVEGRTDAAARARALFDDLAGGRLSSAQLGGLSISDARSALVDLITSLRDSTAGSGTGGFNESRQITEVTGSRLAGLLGTGNTYLARIAADIAAIAQGYQFAALTPIAPVLPSGLGGAAAAGGVVISGVTINITLTLSRELLGADASDAIALGNSFGRAVGDSAIAAIDQQLRDRQLRQRLLNGDPRITR